MNVEGLVVGKKVSFFGSRQVVLTGVIVSEVGDDVYCLKDDLSGILLHVHKSQIL